MSNYDNEMKKKVNLTKLRVELRDKSLEKYFDNRESIDNEDEISMSEVNRIVKEKMSGRKLQLRKFKKLVLRISLIAAGVGAFTYCKSIYTPELKAAMTLNTEMGIHGGLKADGKYIYSLEEHIKSGECVIPDEAGLSMEDRVDKFCDENNLSEEVKEAAMQKFDYYYHGNYMKGNKISLTKIVLSNQREQRKNKNGTSSKDELTNLKAQIEKLREIQSNDSNNLGM